MKLFGIAIICNACSTNQENNAEKKEFLVTSPIIMDTNYVSEYVADIHSLQNVEIRTKIKGHLENIYIDEGSSVKTGQVLFSIQKEGFQLELLKAQSKLKSAIAELKVDEMNVTANVQGYDSPNAFTKRGDEKTNGKKQADLTGYSVVKESKEYKKGDKLKIKLPNGKKFDVVFDMYSRTKGVALGKFKDGSGEYTIKPFNLNTIVESMNENRWLELKRDESTAQSKIGKGISNINKQLREMERFLNWYGKIKNESGVDNKSYWKRTNSHIYSIKERLLKLDQKIRQISE
jgi:membrane fusion protein (multidrug efflux system)